MSLENEGTVTFTGAVADASWPLPSETVTWSVKVVSAATSGAVQVASGWPGSGWTNSPCGDAGSICVQVNVSGSLSMSPTPRPRDTGSPGRAVSGRTEGPASMTGGRSGARTVTVTSFCAEPLGADTVTRRTNSVCAATTGEVHPVEAAPASMNAPVGSAGVTWGQE